MQWRAYRGREAVPPDGLPALSPEKTQRFDVERVLVKAETILIYLCSGMSRSCSRYNHARAVRLLVNRATSASRSVALFSVQRHAQQYSIDVERRSSSSAMLAHWCTNVMRSKVEP